MRLHPSPLVLASAVCCQFLDQLGVVLKNEARTGVFRKVTYDEQRNIILEQIFREDNISNKTLCPVCEASCYVTITEKEDRCSDTHTNKVT